MTRTALSAERPTVDSVLERARVLTRAMDQLLAEDLEISRTAQRELRGASWSVEGAEGVGLARGLVLAPVRALGTTSPHGSARQVRLLRRRQLASLRPHLRPLRDELARLLAGSATEKSRWWRGRREDTAALSTANAVHSLLDWADKTGFAEDVTAAASGQSLNKGEGALATSDLIQEAFSELAAAVGAVEPASSAVLSGDEVRSLDAVAVRGVDLLSARERLASSVKSAFEAVQARMVDRRLSEMKLDTLHAASMGQVRIGPLESAGVTSVQDVLAWGRGLSSVRGMSHQSAGLAVSTAQAIRREVLADLKLRIDLDESDKLLSDLITGLHALLGFDDRLDEVRGDLEALIGDLQPLRPALASGEELAIIHRESPRRGRDVTRFLQQRAAWVRENRIDVLLGESATRASGAAGEAWDDFKRRSPVYYGLLGEIVGYDVDVDAVQGHLPNEIVAAVERQGLDTSLLKKDLRASLRGYQSFGARYALVQRRVLLGDEMGLGKTIQAIAAMAHLAASGSRHFVVVCPPAVLVNWIKEIRRHSDLEVHRIHGPERDRERDLRWWRQRGGVAVTSFNLLAKHRFADPEPAMLVVDEAHFVKNPTAQRSIAVRDLVEVTERALFMTGTPLENRVEEFVSLVQMLQKDVLDDLAPASMVAGTRRFREAVASVYLRRNADDVLSELPDLVQVEDWVDHSSREESAYLDAVGDGDFHAMRQTAFTADPRESQKLERLEEVVEEALSNNRKVLVFSYYLEVIKTIRDRLGDSVLGVITGGSSPDERQRQVDRFTASTSPGVLVSQIVAGGVGLNLQAASVVVLCEPQVKPSLEHQAIKRAHRMGQVQTVQVHRLLTTDSVDERLMAMLSLKEKLFTQFAATSEVADASPEATDITEAQLIRGVIEEEQARHLAELRSRMGGNRPVAPPSEEEAKSPDQFPDSAESAPKASAQKPGPAPPKSPPARDPAPLPPRFKPSTTPVFRSVPHEDQPAVLVCQSCARPIDFNGHCGCS